MVSLDESRFDWESPTVPRGMLSSQLLAIQEAARRRSAADRKIVDPPPAQRVNQSVDWAAISAARQLKEKQLQLWNEAEIPTEFQEADLMKIDPKFPLPYRQAAEAIGQLLRVPGTALLCGERQRGKSWLSCGLCRIFCRARYSALYVNTQAEITRSTMTSFEQDRRALRRERLEKDTLLILDEAERNLVANQIWLETLVSVRSADRRSTLIIMANSLEVSKQQLGPTILQRLIQRKLMLHAGGQAWPAIPILLKELNEQGLRPAGRS